MGLNLRKAPMSDPAFRRALALVIDKEFLAGEALASEVIPMHSLIPLQNTTGTPTTSTPGAAE